MKRSERRREYSTMEVVCYRSTALLMNGILEGKNFTKGSESLALVCFIRDEQDKH